MASLRKLKLPSGQTTYQISYYRPAGNGTKKRVQKIVGPDYKHAQKIVKVIEAKEVTGDWGLDPRKDSLHSMVAQYLTLKQARVKPNSLVQQDVILNRFATYAAEQRIDMIQQVDAVFVEGFLQQQLKAFRPQTVNKYLRIIKTFFRDAVHKDLIPKSPCERIKPFRSEESTREALSPKEQVLVIQAVHNTPCELIVLTALFTGLRFGELLNLEWSDVDFEQNILRVKNREGFSTKSRKERIVPLPKNINHLLQTSRRNLSGKIFNPQSLPTDKMQWRIYHQLEKALGAAGLPQCKFHVFRHTYLTNLARAGISPAKIQQWAGHSSYNITAKVYTHLNEYDPEIEKIVS